MATDPRARAELGGAALDHAPRIDAVHRLVGQRAGAADGGAEEGGLAAVADARRLYIADSPPFVLLFEEEQRARGIGERCRVEDLDAGIMFPVERGVGARTACRCGVSRRIEPKPKVIKLHGIGLHAYSCLRDDGGRVRKHIGRGRRWDARGNNESLDIEPADEIADTDAVPIGVNVADIPGEPERPFGTSIENKSKSVFGGRPLTLTSRFSNSPKE